ncbi:MAG: ATP-dependent nuclease [Acidimicrobiales bacterium]
MRLISFRVERFRNILDSGTIEVDSGITCLVGKNESGKTNILHALHALNPALTDRLFDEQQYPRWLQKEHQRTAEFETARPISATFELTDDEADAVSARFGAGVLMSNRWTLSVAYDNSRAFTVEVDEAAACRAFEELYGLDVGALKLGDLRDQVEKEAGSTAFRADSTEKLTPAAIEARATQAALDALYPATVADAVCEQVAALVPRFFHFDEYSELLGRTDIGPLIKALRTDSESVLDDAQRTALALLKLGFATDELVNPDYEKRSGEMEAVAADLTRQVRRYWHQNDHLRLKIDIEPTAEVRDDGTNVQLIQLRVEDDRHYFTNNLDVRSSGFRWFISFLAAFKEFYSDTSVIVLLDEPALALHARAQQDFLDFIADTLAAHHQVVYTTHSPFMVDPNHLERVRVVEDLGPDEGTKVSSQFTSRDPDTLSPLQGALGYDIATHIFVGSDNLVVEDLTDYTYLTVISEVLRGLDRAHLDERWRVLPAGGAGTMPAAISLLGLQLDVTVVVNGSSRSSERLNLVQDHGVLEARRIIMLGPLAGMQTADVEDLFDPEDYLVIYNATTGSSLTVSQLEEENDERILDRIRRVAGEFNRSDASNWFLRNRKAASYVLRPVTLNRFEALFRSINETLS